jgi:transposase
MDFYKGGHFNCPECKTADLGAYDTTDKVWRHLNFFQYKCFIHLRTPRLKCPTCKGVKLWMPPWSREQSGFTLLFEVFLMQLAKVMPVLEISKLVSETDTRIWRVIGHWVKNAYKDKQFTNIAKIGIDETSSRKGHNYVTIFADVTTSDVLYATVGKDKSTIERFVKSLNHHNARLLKSLCKPPAALLTHLF